jgi:hexosaminidase
MMNPQNTAATLLPKPYRVVGRDAPAQLRGATKIIWAGDTDARTEAYALRILSELPCGLVAIQIADIDDVSAPQEGMDEGYELRVTAEQILLKAHSTWGALHGITTLRQLMSAGGVSDGLHITDSPRFSWRGCMLDVTRHFIPLAQLYQVVDGLQLLKLNVLHLHLSDDQGFRFGSRIWPKLVSDEHYTMEQLSELVAYAADRGIRLIPELDVPGHVTHWLLAYPQWGSEEVYASQRFGVHPGCLDPTREEVYAALSSLFAEIAEVFPDQYVHVGGDEVNPKWWQRSEAVQAFIVEHGLADERGLQNYFLHCVQQILTSLGRQIIGWDEVLHEQMPECVVQNWRGATTRDRALAAARSCIVSAPYYLDLHFPADIHYQFDPEASQQSWLAMENALAEDRRLRHIAPALSWTHQWRAGAIELEYEPAAKVLGGEACLWAELVDGPTLPMRLWSRLPAIAERLWSTADCRDSEDFYRRLPTLLEYPELSWDAHQNRCLQDLGLSAIQIEVVRWLEPTKWYSRLLGAQAMQARLQGNEMPQARPYQVHTPLNRVVDYLAPESISARILVREMDLQELMEKCDRALAQLWSGVDEDVVTALTATRDALQLTQDANAGRRAKEQVLSVLEERYQPHGEYMPALIPHLIDRLTEAR